MKVIKYIFCIALVMGFVGVASNAIAQPAVLIPLNPTLCCTATPLDPDMGLCVSTVAHAILGDCVKIVDDYGNFIEAKCQLIVPFDRPDKLPMCRFQAEEPGTK